MSYIRRMPNASIDVRLEPYTPAQGERWAQGNGLIKHFGGTNPFAPYGSNADGLFRGISPSAFLTAVGMAIKSYSPAYAFVAFPKLREDTQTSGNILRRTVTTTTNTYASPEWFLGVPLDAGYQMGTTAGYEVPECIARGCDRRTCFAASGASFVKFTGGNMPGDEQLVHTQRSSRSGFSLLATILAVIVIVVVAVFTGGRGVGSVGCIRAGGNCGWGWFRS